jgi:8-oxo-dGTP pyrophosphatase MutT (NUDIX family)
MSDSPVRDVVQMLGDEYEAIHGVLPRGWDEAPGAGAPGDGGSLDRRLRAFYALVHALPAHAGRSALCLSGGGIRSAAFSLGVLQALARAGVLQRFHYLSTVSGGGYIGAWLTAWIHRHFSEARPAGAGGTTPRSVRLGEVATLLASRADGRGGDRPPEAEQVAHLRRFTNYLSPHPGAFSLDTWTLVAVYLRNLALNWTVVVPLLAAAVATPLLLEGLIATVALADRAQARLAALVVPAALGFLGWLGLALATALRWRLSDVGVLERWSRGEGWCLRFGASWLVFAALVLHGPRLLQAIPDSLSFGALGGVSGLATYFLKRVGDRDDTPEAAGRPSARLVRAATTGAALLTIALLLIALATAVRALADWTGGLPGVAAGGPLAAAGAVALGALAASAVAALVVDINEFSLHALYRNRLVRAFLRASRGADAPQSDIAFDAKDDLPLVRLWPHEPPRPDDPGNAPHLFHVINATLNDVGGTRPEWQERKGVSFTFSPLHVGAHIPGRYREVAGTGRGGYRRLDRTGEDADPLRLGTAMSISGAAASPNMGYHSSPVVTFLMALLNVRLGWWMRPPWGGGSATTLGGSPLTVWGAWWGEAFGATRLTSAVLNVSDGGHFDNLGLYEMVRRRCRSIVVVDAGQDRGPTFDALAEALRKIRVDFGVPITLTGLDLSDRSPGHTAAPAGHAYYGRIQYSRVDVVGDGTGRLAPAPDGELVYIKPVVAGSEPVDVQSYRRRNPAFPHETTVDQWFSESQFESYRALGEHSVQHLLDYYRASKGQPRRPTGAAPAAAPGGLTPQAFCHRVAEALALRRRHREDSSHAGGVLYRRCGGAIEFLLVRSTDHLHRVLPKGYVEPWEDAVTAAAREVREEAGFDLAPARSLGVSSFETKTRTVTTTYFLMEEATADPPGLPHEDFRAPAWFTVEAVRAGRTDLPVPEDVIEVLEKAQRLLG